MRSGGGEAAADGNLRGLVVRGLLAVGRTPDAASGREIG